MRYWPFCRAPFCAGDSAMGAADHRLEARMSLAAGVANAHVCLMQLSAAADRGVRLAATVERLLVVLRNEQGY